MSMYVNLLSAALGQRPFAEADAEANAGADAEPERYAIEEVRRRRAELERGVPPGTDGDAVPLLLAQQVGYDVALMELARAVGIDTGPDRFEQPQQERARLEQAIGERGISLDGRAQRANGSS